MVVCVANRRTKIRKEKIIWQKIYKLFVLLSSKLSSSYSLKSGPAPTAETVPIPANNTIPSRYRRSIITNYQKEQDTFVVFLSDRLNMEIRVDKAFFDTPNDTRMKKFLGRVVGTISRTYYAAIRDQAYKLRLHTYELRYNSHLFSGELKDDSFMSCCLANA